MDSLEMKIMLKLKLLYEKLRIEASPSRWRK